MIRQSWRARRRKGAPRPTAVDLQLWTRFVARAEKLAGQPQGVPSVLIPALRDAERVANAVMPPGHQGKDSVFVSLRHLVRRWPTLLATEQTAQAGELRQLVEDCQAALIEPEPRQRRDIHE